MRINQVVLIVGLAALANVAPASAQGRVPAARMWAASGSIGATSPPDASLENGLAVDGSLERYLTPRVSIRGQLGASWWDITGRHFSGTVTPVFLDGNLVYNWEGGVWHPFVTGGVGLYRFHASESATRDDTDTEPGVNGGGGVELFFAPDKSMTTELTYHKVGDVRTPLATFADGSFWRFSVGAKFYWR
jgi:outer membrane protein with beta-barrel domain